jgi:exopolyphosphatase / guanosine-5'-triphosphate,3'-diphosphate pyrophosphatase
VGNRSRKVRRAALYAASPKARKRSAPLAHAAKGRLDNGPPIAVIDIGSNSIRLVAYEGLTRAPTPIFNEKILAGLGRQVQSTGLLAPEAMETALAALRRFRALCDTLEVARVWAIATAACRDADNGHAFTRQAERILKTPIRILSGTREAYLTGLGIVSGMHRPDGIVGDLGGGSLELIDVRGTRVRRGLTVPLGGLALADIAGSSLKRAEKFVDKTLGGIDMLADGEGRTLYAVGGTWRALARLHMWQTGYPFHVMHNYRMPAREALEFARLVHRVDTETLSKIEVVSAPRRPLLAYAALVMEHLVRGIKPKDVVISVLGVREGLLYSRLKRRERAHDPLLSAAAELNQLRSRSPRHGEELIGWTDRFMASTGLDETVEERRLRHAACLLADIGWRAHPEYRGEQSMNIIANGAFVAIDHPGRAYLALSVYFRHAGLGEDELSPRLRELASTRMLDRARVLGAAFRVAYIVSAAQGGVLPKAPLQVKRGKLVLSFKGRARGLAGERLLNRLRQLGRLIGREAVMEA